MLQAASDFRALSPFGSEDKGSVYMAQVDYDRIYLRDDDGNHFEASESCVPAIFTPITTQNAGGKPLLTSYFTLSLERKGC